MAAAPLGVALLIGSSLAPTDAALGQPVIADQSVPVRVRRMLNVESGLNDGIATPFVLVAVAIAAHPGAGGAWIADAALEIAIAVGLGVVIGRVGGLALVAADARGWTTPLSRQPPALAVALTCYRVSVGLHGNGFIAAVVGGLAFGRLDREAQRGVTELTESVGSLLAIGVWTAFGLVAASMLLPILLEYVAYAVLSLTLIRMLPVGLALRGTRFRWPSVALIGWFGPRALASMVFLVIGIDGLKAVGIDAAPYASTVAWTVLLSVVLHGLTVGPLARRYGRFVERLPLDAPERASVDEMPAGRRSWVHPAGEGYSTQMPGDAP